MKPCWCTLPIHNPQACDTCPNNDLGWKVFPPKTEFKLTTTINEPPAPPAPCTHYRCEWDGDTWKAYGRYSKTDWIGVDCCPDCGAHLPESGPRKVTGLWPEAVAWLRTVYTSPGPTGYSIRDGRMAQSILDAAGEGEQ